MIIRSPCCWAERNRCRSAPACQLGQITPPPVAPSTPVLLPFIFRSFVWLDEGGVFCMAFFFLNYCSCYFSSLMLSGRKKKVREVLAGLNLGPLITAPGRLVAGHPDSLHPRSQHCPGSSFVPATINKHLLLSCK